MAELRDQLQETLGISYTLEQELGGGGMSRVFVAEESALGRKVVVKVLPAEMAAAVSLDRFRREIQLAARLQHPHIVPLLTAGETQGLPYFTMPFVRGESLRAKLAKGGELPVSETIRILREVASALAYAHENHVVHRDIKPENVLISGGSAVVTDFGVAKALSASSGASGMSLTSMGVALGTPAYMSPEQATADPNTDHRADIYALGVMGYEMLTGSTPFQGRSPQATLAAHVTEKPDAITNRRSTIPPVLGALVMSCLEKRPADRPQTASEIMQHLDALNTPSGGLPPAMQASGTTRVAAKSFIARTEVMIGMGVAAVALIAFAGTKLMSPGSKATGLPAATATAEVPVIAVIPFENLGKAEGVEFTDGITEEITSRLSALRGLRVIGRQTSKGYANTTKTPQQIATELGVNYLLTGTVRWDRNSDGKELVRVSPALIRTSDATQVWGEPYQTVLSGIFEVQSKVATEVASALNVALLEPDRAALDARPTDNVEAYAFYLRGTELVRSTTTFRGLKAGIEALEKAVALDPSFALAFAQLAIAHTEFYWFQADHTPARLRLAKAAADKALSLNPTLGAAHRALGIYYYHGLLDYSNALRELSIAEKGAPNDFEAVFYKAAIQRRQGKWKESIANMNRAIDIEPGIGLNMSDLGQAHLFLRDYDEAERLANRTLTVSPSDPDAFFLKSELAIARDGDVAKATRVRRQQFDEDPDKDKIASIGAMLRLPWPSMTDATLRRAIVDATWNPDLGEKHTFYASKAMFHHMDNNVPRARAYADSAIVALRSMPNDRQDDVEYWFSRARSSAILGNKTEALEAIDRAAALRPMSKDAYSGPDVMITRAQVLVLVGDKEAAIAELDRLLKMPALISKNAIKLNPFFASLRTSPSYARLGI